MCDDSLIKRPQHQYNTLVFTNIAKIGYLNLELPLSKLIIINKLTVSDLHSLIYYHNFIFLAQYWDISRIWNPYHQVIAVLILYLYSRTSLSGTIFTCHCLLVQIIIRVNVTSLANSAFQIIMMIGRALVTILQRITCEAALQCAIYTSISCVIQESWIWTNPGFHVNSWEFDTVRNIP